jgi:ubiquinone/menaquinone biosynthesis C-methylase UbiE
MPGARILDVGSGLGSLAIELALAGAEVTAVDPFHEWRTLSAQRARSLGITVHHIDADARRLPFENDSFDGCVTLQVLEHIQHSKQAILEIARVLKPGGRFFISCENYLSFREPHYRVRWLPFLPKFIGAMYLTLLGRDPTFLRKYVHFTYWPLLAKWIIESNLMDDSWASRIQSHQLASSQLTWKYRVLSALTAHLPGTMRDVTRVCAWNRRKLFGPGFRAHGRKVGA